MAVLLGVRIFESKDEEVSREDFRAGPAQRVRVGLGCWIQACRAELLIGEDVEHHKDSDKVGGG